MERATPDRGVEHPAHVAAIGTAITAFAFLDAYTVGLLIAALAAWLPALIVFAVAAVVLTVINGACCRWVERQWDAWIAGNAERMEATLAKRRKSRVMRHPVAWITRGSDLWFTLAAILMNPVIVIALARLIAGQPVGPRRLRLAAAGYSIFFAAVFSAIGFAAGDAIRAA